MSSDIQANLAVLGGGPAGYLGAIRAAQLGASVVIVEERDFGGVCLNRGCIPTKALLRNSEIMQQAGKQSAEFGVQVGPPVFNWLTGYNRKERVVKTLRLGVEQLLAHNKIQVVRGKGLLQSPQDIIVEMPAGEIRIDCQNILLATGSESVLPPIPGIDLPKVLTSDEALALQEIPTRLVIIGGGVIGVEFATLFQAIGTKVTILEMADQIIPQEDGEITGELLKVIKRQGIDVKLSTKVSEIAEGEQGLTVVFETAETLNSLTADYVLVATGRKARMPAGLSALGIRTGGGIIIVNERLETNISRIYAAGDLTGGKLLAHKAYAEGRAAVESALGYQSAVQYNTIPSCVYTKPEIASVGMQEREAEAQGVKVNIGKFNFRNNGRALCMGERDGMVKVVVDRASHVILGAQILGAEATELISEMTLAVSLSLKAEVIADLIHPHPTLSEAIMEACADAIGRAVHKA